MVESIEALGTLVEEFVLNRLQKATFFNVMADECTDTTRVLTSGGGGRGESSPPNSPASPQNLLNNDIIIA